MALTTFSGPVKSNNGFIGQGAADLTADTTLTVNDHAGRVLTTNDADGKFTLPTITSDNIGSTFTFYVETAATDMDIKTDGTDKFVGGLYTGVNNDTGKTFISGASNDVITMNGTTTGGLVGSMVTATAIATAKYVVSGIVLGSGTLATPFADA
jgi:hypothetical protein